MSALIDLIFNTPSPREGGEGKARSARQLEKDQADEVAIRTAERQRIEDALQAQIKTAERAVAAAKHPDWEEKEALGKSDG